MLMWKITVCSGPGSSAGKATDWTVWGSNTGGGRDFTQPSRPALWPTQPSVQWVEGLSPGVKSGRAWHWPLTPFQYRGQERVKLDLYTPYGPYGLYRASVPLQGCNLPFLYRL